MKIFNILFILILVGCTPRQEIDLFLKYKKGKFNPIMVRSQDFGSYIKINYFETCPDYTEGSFDNISKDGIIFLFRNLEKFQNQEPSLRISCDNTKLILTLKVSGRRIDTLPLNIAEVDGLKLDTSRFKVPTIEPDI